MARLFFFHRLFVMHMFSKLLGSFDICHMALMACVARRVLQRCKLLNRVFDHVELQNFYSTLNIRLCRTLCMERDTS